MKKSLVLFLTLMMCVSLFACAAKPAEAAATPAPVATEAPVPTEEPVPATVQFTDSVGRVVELPADITKIAISGPLAQIVLFALCPDKLVGVASKWDATAEQYLATEYYNLPELGQLYGGKGELNLETLLASGAPAEIQGNREVTEAYIGEEDEACLL